MSRFMLISLAPAEIPADFEITPEMIQTIISKYNAWTTKLQNQGCLLDVNKLRDSDGRVLRGYGEGQVVTDGPYAETKEVIGGYWLITASSYQEAVDLARDCPTLEFGGTIEVREIEEFPTA